MNSTEIREILTGTFSDEADRAYWVAKLAKAERVEAAEKADPEYYASLKDYVRLSTTEVA